MNWFDTSGLTSLAKTALKEAQKTIDKALDIQEVPTPSPERSSSPAESPPGAAPADFLSSWGLTTSAESPQDATIVDQPITESPSKANAQSLWGSFAGSFFEHKSPDESYADVNPEHKLPGSQDNLTSGGELVLAGVHDRTHSSNDTKRERTRSKTEENVKPDDKTSALHLNRLSIVSCDSGKNSSESVEVLGSQMTTPDSEGASIQSTSLSSGTNRKHLSESVEILPDSLVSPSIECLGFDSCGTRTQCSSSNVSPLEELPDKTTPTGTASEAAQSVDSVSLVVDDDEDTISYNSVSECTVPTILDTHCEDKPVGIQPIRLRSTDSQRTRLPDIKDSPTEHSTLINLNPSENYASSNDGSWSDRTLNAEDSDVNIEDKKTKQIEKEVVDETFTDKLSDSSSFYNVNMGGEAANSEQAAYVNVDKTSHPSPARSPENKKRVSPSSSESRSEIVKIGSDQTSTHTSGDELETATSSDIEIIPSPNGDNSHVYCRASPAKYAMKNSKLDGNSSPYLVDLVLGKSLATKLRGHTRELSEASIQSNTSDDSHCSENERLLRRLCELSEILEARDNRIAEISRSNADLEDGNALLKSQIDSLKAKHEAGDSNLIVEDYAQRISALEKKFQQAIKDKDMYRKQMESLKSECSTRRTSELESMMKEKDEMIAQLQEEGEKLAKQQFTQSNIIKKLRVKEKENEQVIKSLRDKIAEQASELDRLKRSISAKEELEVKQIETVYKLTAAYKKLETESEETKSTLDDTLQKLSTSKTSLEAARRELVDLQKCNADMKRQRDAAAAAESEKRQAEVEAERLAVLVENLRAKIVQDEKRHSEREERLRRELAEAREGAAAREAEGAGAGAGAPLLAQLAALQQSALERDAAHRLSRERLTRALAEAENAALSATERERIAREDCTALQEQMSTCESERALAERQREELREERDQLASKLQQVEESLMRTREELCGRLAEAAAREAELQRRLAEAERALCEEREALDAERRRCTLLQEQVVAMRAPTGDVSPSHSLASDSLSASLWTQEEGSERGGAGGSVHGLDEVLARLQRREGEVRGLALAAAAHTKQLHALNTQLANTRHALDKMQGLQEQYDTLLQMYGEKEEQTQELRLDLQDVTKLYKSQLDEIIALKRQLAVLQQ